MLVIAGKMQGSKSNIFKLKLPINRRGKGSLQLMEKGSSMLPIFGSKRSKETKRNREEKGEEKNPRVSLN